MVYRKTKRTEERKEVRRRLFLDCATRLFGKHGYHSTTVPMIVTEAGSSIGSFYTYFRNKEDVFNAALEELGGAIAKVVEDVKQSEPNIPFQIYKTVESVFLFLAENPELARILIVESSGLSPRLDKTRRQILLDREADVKESLELAPELFSAENSLIAAHCMIGAIFEALYNWLEENRDTRLPAARVAHLVATFVLRALVREQAQLPKA